MTILRRWLDYLDRSGVRYSHSVHVPAQTALETADAERIPARDFAKPVVYLCETGVGMAVVPADEAAVPEHVVAAAEQPQVLDRRGSAVGARREVVHVAEGGRAGAPLREALPVPGADRLALG